MQILGYDDDSLPTTSFEAHNQRRQHRWPTSCCGASIHPRLLTDCLSSNSLSYDRLPKRPLKLTIRKLDGSSFDVEVARTANVAELKQAVEGVFSYLPKKGPAKISWSHVWGHFALCYDDWKLLADSEPISNYGIHDGDQLIFVRHVATNRELVKQWDACFRRTQYHDLKANEVNFQKAVGSLRRKGTKIVINCSSRW